MCTPFLSTHRGRETSAGIVFNNPNPMHMSSKDFSKVAAEARQTSRRTQGNSGVGAAVDLAEAGGDAAARTRPGLNKQLSVMDTRTHHDAEGMKRASIL